MAARRLRGDPVAREIRAAVRDRVAELAERDVVPTLGTVLMSDDPSDGRFMDLKHDACADLGIETVDRRLDPTAPAETLYRAVGDLSRDPGVDAVFVQVPLPEHASIGAVRERIDPRKDVDCFHPETLGRLVTGDPRYLPATPAAVSRLLAAYDYDVAGKDVVVIGRSAVIGRPLANLLWQRGRFGNATVTVCHSHTRDLAEKTRRADVVVTACGVPALVDGSMLAPGAVVVDASANRVVEDGSSDESPGSEPPANRPATVVGDVDYESARQVADAITPVPGGIGPVTLAVLAENVVRATDRRR